MAESECTRDFVIERDRLVESLCSKALAFERMAYHVRGAETAEMLKQRIWDCQQSHGMFGEGVSDA